MVEFVTGRQADCTSSLWSARARGLGPALAFGGLFLDGGKEDSPDLYGPGVSRVKYLVSAV